MRQTSGYLQSLVIFLLALLGYLLVAQDLVYERSIAPAFVNLAAAFLRGETYLSMDALSPYDLIPYADRWYVAQPPLPAILLVPFVLLFITPSDVMFGVLVGALNVMVCERVLHRAVPDLTWWRRWLLTAFFGFGTAHLYLAAMGTVWFLGQTCAVLLVWLFLAMVIARQPLWAGVALGIALLARPSIAPGAVLFALLFWGDNGDYRRFLWRFILPIGLGCLVLVGYNALRFGSPLEFGYHYLNDSETIRERRLTYGSFSLAFLPENVYVATIKPPQQFDLGCLVSPDCAAITPDLWGLGLLWTNPLLLAGIWAWRSRLFKPVLIGTSLIMLPSLLYHNTGSAQFGYRFVLDALPLWLLVVASAVRTWKLPLLSLSTGYSVAVHVVGTLWFMYALIPAFRE
jgi:hypothetical protein